MKVKIGNYPNRMVSRLYTNYSLKEGFDENSKTAKFLDKLDDVVQGVYNVLFNWYLDKREQKIVVKIDRWDTWSMDYTLSLIILPMLKQVKEQKQGAPFVDFEDTPKHLHPTPAEIDAINTCGNTDDNYFKRWDWILDEMIWTFEQEAEAVAVFMIEDEEERAAHVQRHTNGLRLFGKYYSNLWT